MQGHECQCVLASTVEFRSRYILLQKIYFMMKRLCVFIVIQRVREYMYRIN